jgi:hypothetical protein
MQHWDYTLDIEYGHYIILDKELPLEKIQFKEGDILEVCKTPDGCAMFRIVDPIVKFTLGFPRIDNDQE